jgi:Tol biopolymer transport system component
LVDSTTTATGESNRAEQGDRLDSWKRIASYLKRDVSTVQRWERREGMPVHRHVHDKLGSVFAFRSELDEWWQGRRTRLGDGGASERAAEIPSAAEEAPRPSGAAPQSAARRLAVGALLASLMAAVAGGAWFVTSTDRFWRNPLADAKFIPAATFAAAARAAALSRDGRFVAFLAERDGRTDAWLGDFGGDRYRDLTEGAVRDLANPSVRTLGFSADSSLVSIWTRQPDGSEPDDVGLLSAPTAGGDLRPYLPNVAELDWSPDGRRMVYHTTAPGDPLFVRELDAGGEAADRQIHVAPAGVHDHFPIWSPDGAFIYFVRGVPRDHWDVWRIRPSGAGLERITRHDSQVAYPVMLDARTLLYLATDADGSGPWIYAMDVERRIAHRVSSGLETYTSLSASGSGARLAATVARRGTSLWRIPLANDGSGTTAREPTQILADGRSPRIGRGFVLFAAAHGDRQGVWTLENGTARELWGRAGARIVGAPAIAADGGRIAFTAEHDGSTRLYAMNADGSGTVVLSESLELRGSPVWWPDGQSVVSAALHDGEPRLTRIFLNGAAPAVLVSEYSVDPVWSPGGFLVYSGADVGTTFPLRAAEADGRAHPIAGLMLTRGARRVAFLGGRPTLVFLRGELGHKNLWLLDLQSGTQSALTDLPQDFVIGDFDVSPDGSEVILDRVEESSTLALIERRQ